DPHGEASFGRGDNFTRIPWHTVSWFVLNQKLPPPLGHDQSRPLGVPNSYRTCSMLKAPAGRGRSSSCSGRRRSSQASQSERLRVVADKNHALRGQLLTVVDDSTEDSGPLTRKLVIAASGQPHHHGQRAIEFILWPPDID